MRNEEGSDDCGAFGYWRGGDEREMELGSSTAVSGCWVIGTGGVDGRDNDGYAFVRRFRSSLICLPHTQIPHIYTTSLPSSFRIPHSPFRIHRSAVLNASSSSGSPGKIKAGRRGARSNCSFGVMPVRTAAVGIPNFTAPSMSVS